MIKYLIMDVDGTLTDGKIYMGNNGECMKAFSVKDGYVINYILKSKMIEPIIITARSSDIVRKRCEELGIERLYQGKSDKYSALLENISERELKYCAYFGDDILDLKCMIPIKEAGGIVACPVDAVKEVKEYCNYVCINKAGDGALREFVEWMLQEKPSEELVQERVRFAINYIKKLDKNLLDIGKYEVEDFFYYLVEEYTTKQDSECEYESHRRYIDIQYIVCGEERIDIVNTSFLSEKKEYDKERDIIFWNPSINAMQVVLKEGSYIVLYPDNAHRGTIMVDKACNVKKIVGKVRII